MKHYIRIKNLTTLLKLKTENTTHLYDQYEWIYEQEKTTIPRQIKTVQTYRKAWNLIKIYDHFKNKDCFYTNSKF